MMGINVKDFGDTGPIISDELWGPIPDDILENGDIAKGVNTTKNVLGCSTSYEMLEGGGISATDDKY